MTEQTARLMVSLKRSQFVRPPETQGESRLPPPKGRRTRAQRCVRGRLGVCIKHQSVTTECNTHTSCRDTPVSKQCTSPIGCGPAPQTPSPAGPAWLAPQTPSPAWLAGLAPQGPSRHGRQDLFPFGFKDAWSPPTREACWYWSELKFVFPGHHKK